MREAYALLYDHALTDAEIDEILWLEMQGEAAHYDQFRSAP